MGKIEGSPRSEDVDARVGLSPEPLGSGFSRAEALCGGDSEASATWFRRFVLANICGVGFARAAVLVDANEALLAAIGAQSVDLDIGIPLNVLFAIQDAAMPTLLADQPREYDVTRLDGAQGHVWAAGVQLDEEDWLLVAIDLSERKAAERAIKHLALHDPTTGVPNRRLLLDRLDHALARARRDSSMVALLFCDIDRFKEVNDRFGHRAGDAVLQTTAMRLGSILRQYDTVARVGGDEFVILLERLADPTDATQVAERVRIAIKEPIELDNRELRVTASIGIAFTVAAVHDADTLLRRADDAMYLAKARGRDQVAFHADDLTTRDLE